MRHWVLGSGVAVAALIAAAPAWAAPQCASLVGQSLGAHGRIEAAQAVAADSTAKLPAFCEVKAVLTPVAGSRIGAVFRLPQDWNGKLLGSGGGGWAGNVTLMGAAPGLQRGYATAQTDGGHPGTGVWDNDWASDKEAATDFSWRAIHETAQAARALVQTYYGKPQTKAYYQGCSTGGRMGLMEAQRFPADYDGIIAGAPVYTLQVQTSGMLRNQMFGAPGAAFSAAQLAAVNAAVLNACDAADGRKDGILNSPNQCRWDPAQLACKPGQAAKTCLAPAQVTALRTAYSGIKTRDGNWAAFPLERGGETGWSRFLGTGGPGKDMTRGGGMLGLKGPLFGTTPVDLAALRPDPDVGIARSSAFANEYEAKDPQLTPFFERGGKLILWHGWSDPGPSPVGTIDYVQAVEHTARGANAAMRLFLLPGTEHCGGGPGVNQPDTLTALERWAEQGQAPQTVIATRMDNSMKRPLCAYPKMARHSGTGELNDPATYRCE